MFKEIERLLMVERHGSFSKAAEELFISRSALTQQMKQLEQELGFVIFLRDHKGVCLTEAGACYLEEMQKLRRRQDEVILRCRRIQQTARETLTIGIMPNLSSPFLYEVCEAFRRRCPSVELRFREYGPEEYAARFRAGAFDIAVEYFCNYVHDIPRLKTEPVGITGHSLQVVPGHPLADRTAISFKDLRGYKLMMYRRGITRSEDSLRDYILSHEPEITLLDLDHYDSSLFTVCQLEGALLLAYSAYDAGFPQFRHVPTTWDIPVRLGFCCPADSCSAAADFMTVVRELYADRS